MQEAPGAEEPSSSTAGALHTRLPWAGLVVALVALLPPYTRDLNTEMRVEIADHVVPSILMVAVSVTMLVRARRRTPETGTLPLVAGFAILLAGLWMTATHLPLLNQAREGQNDVSYLDAAWHTVPGLVVMVLGAVWAAAYWSTADEPAPG